MKAIIMAGGEGSRLRPLTCDRPKPMATLFDRPVMEYIIALLKSHGLTQIGVTLQYRPRDIMDYFGDGHDFGVELTYFLEDEPLGTAGSVKNAAAFLDEDFLVISGDCLCDFDLSAAIAAHYENKALATLVLARMQNPLPYGVVVTDPKGKIERFVEKPSWAEVCSDLVNTGIYVLDRTLLSRVPDDTFFDFSKDLFSAMAEKKEALFGCALTGYWCDIGDLSAYLSCQFDMLSGKVASPLLPSLLKNRDHGLYRLTEPCYIGPNVTIEPGAKIGPFCILEEGSLVERGATLKRSLVKSGARVRKNAELRGAVVAEGAVVGPRCALFEGSVVGRGTHLGADCTVLPGIKLWPEKNISENQVLSQNVIWGSRERHPSLNGSGLSGEFGSEITPEALVSLATVFALCLEGEIAVGHDTGAASSALAPLLVSGAAAAGRRAVLFSNLSPGAFRFFLKKNGCAGGLYLTVREGELHLSLLDGRGLPLSRARLAKLSGLLRRGDYSLCPVDSFLPPQRFNIRLADYLSALAEDLELVPSPPCLSLTGAEGSLKEEIQSLLSSYGLLRGSGGPDGVHLVVEPGGLTVVDEAGTRYENARLFLLFCLLYHKQYPRRALCVPPSAPAALFDMGIDLALLKQIPLSAGDLPADLYHSAVHLMDPVFCAGLIAAFLAKNQTLASLDAQIPAATLVHSEVFCSECDKSRVMRGLTKKGDDADYTHGVKIRRKNGGFVLVVPHPTRPLCEIYADALSAELSKELCGFYAEKIRELEREPESY